MAPPALHLAGVRKAFGAFTALRDNDLSVAAGEFVCFLGPSGCGKTTLLRVIAGLETQDAGKIEQGGKDVSALPPGQRDYGIVFQSYALFPNLSVADNVAYGLVNRNTPQAAASARVAELLEMVGLPGSQTKYPAQLSGGQQQRVALARALATSPGLLLLDEPLSALDAIVRVRLRQELRDLQRRLGVTTIMVTHDQEEALSMADRIVVMNRGAIEQVGTPLEVYRAPATPFVADFVGRVNTLNATLENGGARVGSTFVSCAHTGSPGQKQTLYVRPEDVMVASNEVSSVGGNAGIFDASVQHIEFLGSQCLVRVGSAALGDQQLDVLLTLRQLGERGAAIGQLLQLRLVSERVRVFA